jgi:hypothetical protein
MQDSTAGAKNKPASIPLNGARCYLFSTVAIEAAIIEDGLSRPRAFGARYVADAILRQRLSVARIAGKRSKPSHLHSRHLQSVLGGKGYKVALTWLIDRGLIVTDNVYTVGVSSRGYAITNLGWRGGPVPVAMTDLQVERYAKGRARLKRDSEKARREEGVPLDYLHLHLGMLSFEAEEVARYFEEMPKPSNWKEAERIHSYRYSAALVDGRLWTFSRCAAGRLHYPLTNLPKALRRLLRYQGEALVEIDVSSCQPFLASSLYPDRYSNEGTRFEMEMSETAIKWTQEEKRRYLADVRSGFYERIGEAAGWTGSQKDLKREVLKVVFFGSEQQASGPIWEAFEDLYPILASIIDLGKWDLGFWCGDRELALRLQGAEARVFIDGALRRIAEEMPGVPALPLHDCLLTTAGHAEAVLRVLQEEFLSQFGEVPSFEIKAA